MVSCGCQLHMTSKCGEVCYTGKVDYCSECKKKNIFIAGYSKALNDLGVEVFRIIDWGECHGNGQLIARQQVKNIIGSLNTGGTTNG